MRVKGLNRLCHITTLLLCVWHLLNCAIYNSAVACMYNIHVLCNEWEEKPSAQSKCANSQQFWHLHKISATYSVLSTEIHWQQIWSLYHFTLQAKNKELNGNNFLQWIDTSTNIFTIKCTRYHQLKQKLSKFSGFHAPQLPKKAGAFGLCHLQLNSFYSLLKNIFYMLELLWKLAEFRYCKLNTAISL